MTTTYPPDPGLDPAPSQIPDTAPDRPPPAVVLGNKAVWSLAGQHFSSAWGARSYEFASYLFLVTIFPDTLLPASIYGFITTGTAILFSGSVGQLVDSTPRLRFVRACIVLQKVLAALAYSVFLLLFLPLKDVVRDGTHPELNWSLFAVIVVLGSVLNLSSIGINISIERDWVTTICEGSSDSLTRINAYLRRIDLLSKLLAPLFVSLLTTAISYPFAAAFLLGYSVITMFFEFFWINVVWRRLPILAAEEADRLRQVSERKQESREAYRVASTKERGYQLVSRAKMNLRSLATDWKEFVKSPIFPSSLSVSLLYLTVLSFDGTMITFLKAHSFDDAFIAGMRGVCVVTGLMGTFAMPLLESRLGLVRAGSWSIVSEVISLIPVLLSFFVGASKVGMKGPVWNSVMLFGGMAASRIGLWAFDMCQLKEMQIALEKHPRRNSIMGLQYTLQNVLSMLTYVVTIIFSKPAQFKWPSLSTSSS